MKTLALILTFLVAVSAHAQLPATSPAHAGFDPAQLEGVHCQIDPKEKIVAVALLQHFPFNEPNFFEQFATGYYQALK